MVNYNKKVLQHLFQICDNTDNQVSMSKKVYSSSREGGGRAKKARVF
jgi:hypothetical protein